MLTRAPQRASRAHPVHLLGDPLPRRVVVLRALQLGDMLCAVPALRALRAALPQAHITLASLPWARAFVQRFAHYVDDFLEFPGYPGLPEQPVVPERIVEFLAEAQRRRFDFAVQLHGSGSFINECIGLLGAPRSAGFHLPGDYVPDPERFMRWPQHGSEAKRLVALMRFLDLPIASEELEFPITETDRHELTTALAAVPGGESLEGETYVCVHPGARFASRRWPAARFAAVADGLAERGARVVLTGSAGEATITATVAAQMRSRPIDLAGRLTLGALGALLSGAALLVSNDTGVSHSAAGVKVRSVVVASGSDVARWAPHDTERHRVLWHHLPCRPCAHVECPIGHPCALGVSVAAVLGATADWLGAEVAHAS